MTPMQILQHWLDARLPAEGRAWLSEAARKIAAGGDTELYRSVSFVTRKIGKADLALSPAEMAQASVARAEWDPSDWSLDQAARVYLLLASGTDGAKFLRRLDQLCDTADIGELVAFYRGLPLYPDQSRYVLRAAEGVRTSMKAVFEAVAHRNPYPAEQFAEPAWNQMVLKTLFIGTHSIRSWGSISVPMRNWRACSATMRTSAGPRGARSVRSCGVAWGPSRAATCCKISGACWRRAPSRSALALHWPLRRRPIRRRPACYGRILSFASPSTKTR